jgi:hypothetical protein
VKPVTKRLSEKRNFGRAKLQLSRILPEKSRLGGILALSFWIASEIDEIAIGTRGRSTQSIPIGMGEPESLYRRAA